MFYEKIALETLGDFTWCHVELVLILAGYAHLEHINNTVVLSAHFVDHSDTN